ncbi:MAG: reductive dehalogenase domain-containing protein [Candidatus Aminicenantes bacterium]|jgi:hypothetical protein
MLIKSKFNREICKRFDWAYWYQSIGGRTIKSPRIADYKNLIKTDHINKLKGVPAGRVFQFKDIHDATTQVKQKSIHFGADLVGICNIEKADIYREGCVDEEIAIVLGQEMDYQKIKTAPSLESAIEVMRVYVSLAEVTIKLAEWVRSLGYEATVQHPYGDENMHENLLLIPLAIRAGLGELGMHGSVINEKLGANFRIGAVTTHLPLVVDYPCRNDTKEFCENCQACRRNCPAKAIDGKKDNHSGRFLVDTKRCFPYFASNYYCSLCISVCPFGHKND